MEGDNARRRRADAFCETILIYHALDSSLTSVACQNLFQGSQPDFDLA